MGYPASKKPEASCAATVYIGYAGQSGLTGACGGPQKREELLQK